MYHNLEVPAHCQNLWKTCTTLVPMLLQDCPVKTRDLKITRNNPIDPARHSVYLITSGTINETFAGQLIIVHEEGDLVGADALLQKKLSRYENDFAVTVDEYDGQVLLQTIAAEPEKFQHWNQYLDCLIQSYQLLMCHFSRQDGEFSPEFRHYHKGDVIIEAGTEGDEVFTLISGSAKVIHDGTPVGEINKNEIFGAIAALTNTQRTASIIATADCATIVVKSDSFRSLLAARPDTVQQLVTDMARTIVSCNDRIIELSKNTGE